jgi:hypothetical protein
MSSYIDVSGLDLSKWNDAAIGQLIIDDEDLEHAELELCRALGLPEPVLYDDVDENDQGEVETQQKEDMEDWERILSDVIELQERMAKGMKLIQECRRVLGMARSGERRLPYEAFISWRAREKALWDHWKYLKTCSDAQIGEDKWLWHRYFELVNKPLEDRVGYIGDEIDCPQWTTDIDEMKTLWLESEECVEE